MEKIYNVAAIVGSLRKESWNRKVVQALIELAPPSLKISIVEIGQLPLYNQDEDANPPAAHVEFRAKLKSADAFLFATPEYDRSISGVLKNALDVGSRPSGQNVWSGKPGAVISASTGAAGGVSATHHLRQTLVANNVATMAQPEAYIGGADKLFDAGGKLVNDGTRTFLQKYVNAFAAWVAKNAPT